MARYRLKSTHGLLVGFAPREAFAYMPTVHELIGIMETDELVALMTIDVDGAVFSIEREGGIKCQKPSAWLHMLSN